MRRNSFPSIYSFLLGTVFTAGFGTLAPMASAESGTIVLADHPVRMLSFDTANTYHKGSVELSLGTSQANPDTASGTGNQLYYGGGSYAVNDRLMLGMDLHNYVDPVGGLIGGALPTVHMTTLAGWGKYQLYSGDRFSVSALGSIENFLELESPLFGGDASGTTIGALKLPVSYDVSSDLQLHFVPALYYMPSTVNGVDFYGTIASLGFGATYRASDRWALFGTVDAPISGTNTIASDGSYEKTPVWSVGARYNVSPKAALEGYVTNGIGMTPATSVLTFWPEGDEPLIGMRLVYTPGANRPNSYRGAPAPLTARQRTVQQDGFTMGSADVSEPGDVRVSAWYGSDNQAGALLSISPDRDGEFQFIVEQYSDNATADQSLVPTSDARYMLGPKLRLMDQNNGDSFSLSARALYGRRIDTTQRIGVFFAELIGSYKASNGAIFTVNPKVAAFGDTEIAGLGLGVNYAVFDGLDLIAEVTPVALDGSDFTWAAGLRYTVGNSGFSIDAQATNAIGRYGIGGMVAQDDTRVSLTLSKVFNVLR